MGSRRRRWPGRGGWPRDASSAGYVSASKGCLTRVSAGETGNVAGEVLAVTAISADGSSVYFLANGVLAANVGANASHATQAAVAMERGEVLPRAICIGTIPRRGPRAISRRSTGMLSAR